MDHKELAEGMLADYFATPNTRESLALAAVHALLYLGECWEELAVVAIQVDEDEDE